MSAECIHRQECHYPYEPSFFERVGDYLTDVASAIVSLTKRIFCLDDPKTTQDLIWAANQTSQLKAENSSLKKRVQYLENTAIELKKLELKNAHLQGENDQLNRNLRVAKGPTWGETIIIEGVLFFTLMPLYITALPVSLLRSAMYSSATENRSITWVN